MTTPDILKLSSLSQLAVLDNVGQAKLPDAKLANICIFRASDGAKIHILAQLKTPRLIFTSDELGAKSLARKLASWGIKAEYLPHRDDALLQRKGSSQERLRLRMQTLTDMAFGKVDAVVASAESLLQKFPSKRLVQKYSVLFKKEQIISPQDAAKMLVAAGYKRQEMAYNAGEFALRGDMLYVYAPNGTAYRINFFDELIENIHSVDPESMLSSNEYDEILLPPLSDILLDGDGYESALKRLSRVINCKNAAQARSGLREGACSPYSVWALPFLEESQRSILEFAAEDTLYAVFDEPKVIAEKLKVLEKEFENRVKTLCDAGEILPDHRDVYITYNEFRRQLLLTRKISFCSLFLSNLLFEPTMILEPKTQSVAKYYLDQETFASDITNFVNNGMRIVVATGSFERAKSVADSLRTYGADVGISEDGNGEERVQVTPLTVDTGVIYLKDKVVLIGVSDCIGREGKKLGSYGPDGGILSQKTKFTAPKTGDYVVHRVHGVGLCEGTVRMQAGEFEREYVVLRYRDGDILYVATDQMDNLQKFVGEQTPELNKLGGRDFEREKERVKKSVRKLAIDLLDIYARRQKQRGFKYGEDTVWQKQFEDSFEYEETPDQLKAIADIKNDMQSGRIMDRLLVGDVGFGKTEVAFRAMFKTVFDGKQAALIAPTTILARQHYENLVSRLKPFDIKCGLLTRFQTKGENDKLIGELKDGVTHMVVATHKVFSKNVDFNDLGLIVLDEEQRFGVEHKEKLKEKYPLVNVLTLSATPIPRTLNMSLSGIRDISMLETAPQGRLPVQTYVSAYSDALMEDAISRELARGGQTLVLCNFIDRLDAYADKIRELCPDARVVTAHGQMPSNILEKRISDFYDKQYDVLVATTIIENGIDLPDANTLIVIDSERFGLAQLYQLRGRVGRRGALAHAYFTIPDNGVTTVDAEKRLNTLLENTEIGSGFKVALADLSIRGAGNLLGAEQSGHIQKVGYEMYLELLDEAVREIKTGEVTKPVRDVEMRVDITAFIRDGYISSRDKIRVYKRVATVSSVSQRDRLLEELSEVFGEVDRPLENLINISLLKNLAARCDVARIVINKKGAGANFYDADVFKNEALMRAVSENRDFCVLTDAAPPALVFEVNNLTAEQKLEKLIDFFASI